METKDTLSSCSDLDEQEIQQLEKHAKNLESQLNKETLHKKDSNYGLSLIKVQFYNFIHSRVLELSNSNPHALEITQDFKAYTNMEAQTFKETIIQNMNSIEQYIVERASHEQKLQNGLKRLNERKLQIQECTVQKASDASSGNNDCNRIVSDNANVQDLESQSNTSGDESSRSRNKCNDKSTSGDDTDISPTYDTEPMVEQSESISNTCVVETGDSNVIPDSPDMCDNDIQNDQNVIEYDDERAIKESKRIIDSKFLTECKSILAETSRTLGESNSIWDSCLVALQNKQTEFERYKAFNDRTVDYDKLERKLNETLGLLAQKDIDIKEGLKLKAYEILVVQEKHDELVKQSLLTKSHYEGLVKEKTKVITDLKLKEEKDIDKMISMEKQLKFLNEIVYKRNQSIQTIHMLAPKCPTFNGRPTFANPMYLKKAQYEILCLYEIPHDQSDPANRLVPDKEETLTLEKESRSKLNKDLVKHSNDHLHLRALTAHDMEILIKTCLMHLALKTQNDSFVFVHELKQEMHADLKRSSFAKPNDVNAPGPSWKSLKHVSFQSPKESVGSNDMVHNYYLDEAMKKVQLQNDKTLNTKPRVQQSARSPNTANGNKPKPRNFNQQPRNWPPSMSSRVSDKTVNTAKIPRNQNPFLKSNDLACLTCKKCIYSANHDECILKYLSKVNSRTSTQKKDVQSHKTTKRYIPIEKKRESRNNGTSMASEPISSKGSSNVVRLGTSPMIQPEPELSTQGHSIAKNGSPYVGLEMNEYKGIMPTKIELTLEQYKQGVSNDVLAETESIHNLSAFTKMISDTEDDIMDSVMQCITLPSYSSFSQKKLISCFTEIHTTSIDFLTLNGDGDASFQLESDSSPHAHAKTTKTYYKHQDSRIMKAQVLKTKTSANSDIQDLPSRYQVYQGRLLSSFQDDAKYEHVGQDTRSQCGKDNQDKQGKDLKISELKTNSKDNDKGSRLKITQHEGTSLQQRQRPRQRQELNDKSNLIDLMKECHNELTLGEIFILKILSRRKKFVH
ncbi:hypothetical protein Tco_0299829 [Tanacetum coccineum]